MSSRWLVIGLSAAAMAACGGGEISAPASSTAGAVGGAGGATAQVAGDPFDVPLDGVSREEVRAFNQGDALFSLHLYPGDGLGPLYTKTACVDCHQEGTRGPGLVQKMSVVMPDGVTPAADQSKLAFGHTVHPLVAAGATTPIVPPADDAVKVSIRIGPAVLGRGYMEAIADAEIMRVAGDQAARTDAIHGRPNHTSYQSDPNPDTRFHQHQKGDSVIGRFGVKARVPTLDDFTADALNGDMGITSPLRPVEFNNPDGLADDLKPGIDVTADSVNGRATYMRYLAIPRRTEDAKGAALFAQAKCSVCHVPTMKTRADYPIALLAGIDAPVYTDLLLHDMGDTLADGLSGADFEATSREWRTSPLIALRFFKEYLHDGRAKSVEEAITMHDGPGSTASESVQLFQSLSPEDRTALVAFVSAL